MVLIYMHITIGSTGLFHTRKKIAESILTWCMKYDILVEISYFDRIIPKLKIL